MSSIKSVVVIGAGLGGISAAISLRAKGYHVHLYEKNAHIGGKLNISEVDGYKFDLGPSIMILPEIFERLFQMHNKDMKDYFEIEELKPQWRNFFEDGTVVDLYSDIKDMEKELDKFFPSEVDGYYGYIDYSRRLWKFAEEAYFVRGADTLRDVSHGYNLVELAKRTDYFSSMQDGVDHYIKNKYFNNIMSFFIKYIGSSSYNAPAIMNLLAYSQLGYGEYYVKGGMFNISKGLTRLMEEIGIEVHTQTEVVEISKQGTGVNGVILHDGMFVHADYVVSNMEVIPAYEKILTEENEHFMKKYRRRFEPSCSGIVIHLGMDREYPNLSHHNFFFSGNQKKHFDTVYNKYELPEDPTLYVVAPTRTDKTIAPDGHEIIKILPHIPHLQDPKYTKSDYIALKYRIYDKLERMGVEDLRKHIVYEEMLVPDDIERMYYSNKGSIYGVVSDRKKNKGLRAPKRSELYDNLFFVGGSVNPGSGMPMVIYSGQMVADFIDK